MQSTETCSEPGCSGPIRCRALCNRHYQQRWREANAEKCRESVRLSKAKHSDRVRAYAVQYDRENPEVRKASYRRNREKRLAYGARYRAENPEKHLAAVAAWEASHPERHRAKESARRARKRVNGVYRVTPSDIRRLLARLNHTCAYCPTRLFAGFHLDHVMPIARGGSHSIGNLTAACARCNLSKGARTVMEWRMRQSA